MLDFYLYAVVDRELFFFQSSSSLLQIVIENFLFGRIELEDEVVVDLVAPVDPDHDFSHWIIRFFTEDMIQQNRTQHEKNFYGINTRSDDRNRSATASSASVR